MRHVSSLMLAGTLLVTTGCGLNAREQAVVDANESIDAVFVSSESVAEELAALPTEGVSVESFGAVAESLEDYLGTVDAANERLRVLGEHVTELDPYLVETFRPAAEAAAQECQAAIDTFGGTEATPEDLTQAITRTGLCLERYATAVTNVSAEYGRLSN